MTNTDFKSPPGHSLKTQGEGALTYELNGLPVEVLVEFLPEDQGTWVKLTHSTGASTGQSFRPASEEGGFDFEQFCEDGIEYPPFAELLDFLKSSVTSRSAWNLVNEEVQRREANAGKPALD